MIMNVALFSPITKKIKSFFIFFSYTFYKLPIALIDLYEKYDFKGPPKKKPSARISIMSKLTFASSTIPLFFLSYALNDRTASAINATRKKNSETENMNKKTALSLDYSLTI